MDTENWLDHYVRLHNENKCDCDENYRCPWWYVGVITGDEPISTVDFFEDETKE